MGKERVFFILVVAVVIATLVAGMKESEILRYRERARRMFQHGYDNYMRHAYPLDELKPLSCSGYNTWGSFSLTLVDAMDTLLVIGNVSEFQRAYERVLENLHFDVDYNASVFESNIRVLGGLLSSHLLMYRSEVPLEPGWPCSGPLLRLATDLADRLLPAFHTPTGMPYGTVNLRHGVPPGETPVTCVAGIGTFILEFGVLSRLTGDQRYEDAALLALRALWKRRSAIGLIPSHIDTKTGLWTTRLAGIGGGIDSYFEYLLKGGLLFRNRRLIEMFSEFYSAIREHMLKSNWYVGVDVEKGVMTHPHFQSLDAFFPGLQTLVGDVQDAAATARNYHMVWRRYGGIPEIFHIASGKPVDGQESYPLRPELIESTLYLHRATSDPYWLEVGRDMLEAIDRIARVKCGYTTVKNVLTHDLEDRMESFFLSETVKYLYLLFDKDNFLMLNGADGRGNEPLEVASRLPRWTRVDPSCHIGVGGYIFNTEAHPINVGAISCCYAQRNTGRQAKPTHTEESARWTFGADALNGVGGDPAESLSDAGADEEMLLEADDVDESTDSSMHGDADERSVESAADNSVDRNVAEADIDGRPHRTVDVEAVKHFTKSSEAGSAAEKELHKFEPENAHSKGAAAGENFLQVHVAVSSDNSVSSGTSRGSKELLSSRGGIRASPGEEPPVSENSAFPPITPSTQTPSSTPPSPERIPKINENRPATSGNQLILNKNLDTLEKWAASFLLETETVKDARLGDGDFSTLLKGFQASSSTSANTKGHNANQQHHPTLNNEMNMLVGNFLQLPQKPAAEGIRRVVVDPADAAELLRQLQLNIQSVLGPTVGSQLTDGITSDVERNQQDGTAGDLKQKQPLLHQEEENNDEQELFSDGRGFPGNFSCWAPPFTSRFELYGAVVLQPEPQAPVEERVHKPDYESEEQTKETHGTDSSETSSEIQSNGESPSAEGINSQENAVEGDGEVCKVLPSTVTEETRPEEIIVNRPENSRSDDSHDETTDTKAHTNDQLEESFDGPNDLVTLHRESSADDVTVSMEMEERKAVQSSEQEDANRPEVWGSLNLNTVINTRPYREHSSASEPTSNYDSPMEPKLRSEQQPTHVISTEGDDAAVEGPVRGKWQNAFREGGLSVSQGSASSADTAADSVTLETTHPYTAERSQMPEHASSIDIAGNIEAVDHVHKEAHEQKAVDQLSFTVEAQQLLDDMLKTHSASGELPHVEREQTIEGVDTFKPASTVVNEAGHAIWTAEKIDKQTCPDRSCQQSSAVEGCSNDGQNCLQGSADRLHLEHSTEEGSSGPYT